MWPRWCCWAPFPLPGGAGPLRGHGAGGTGPAGAPILSWVHPGGRPAIGLPLEPAGGAPVAGRVGRGAPWWPTSPPGWRSGPGGPHAAAAPPWWRPPQRPDGACRLGRVRGPHLSVAWGTVAVVRTEDWTEQAACRSVDTEVFFPERSGGELYAPGRAYCARCPVSAACLADALGRGEPYGL